MDLVLLALIEYCARETDFSESSIYNTTLPWLMYVWFFISAALSLLFYSILIPIYPAWARAMALGGSCTQPEGPKLSRFINTTPGVTNIIEIIERHAEWREVQAWSLFKSEPNLTSSEKQAVTGRTRWRKGEEQLQYWAFSYGVVLGATFAAIQPHRVKRLINDGACDAEAMFSRL